MMGDVSVAKQSSFLKVNLFTLYQAVEEMGFAFKQNNRRVPTEAAAKDWNRLCSDPSEPLLLIVFHLLLLSRNPHSPPR